MPRCSPPRPSDRPPALGCRRTLLVLFLALIFYPLARSGFIVSSWINRFLLVALSSVRWLDAASSNMHSASIIHTHFLCVQLTPFCPAPAVPHFYALSAAFSLAPHALHSPRARSSTEAFKRMHHPSSHSTPMPAIPAARLFSPAFGIESSTQAPHSTCHPHDRGARVQEGERGAGSGRRASAYYRRMRARWLSTRWMSVRYMLPSRARRACFRTLQYARRLRPPVRTTLCGHRLYLRYQLAHCTPHALYPPRVARRIPGPCPRAVHTAGSAAFATRGCRGCQAPFAAEFINAAVLLHLKLTLRAALRPRRPALRFLDARS
jgi:hypothetical protein